ncbi:LCP family protein [uncultured Eubacterium sp.]|uniref:LCP family protein n=1 Tax=uncultured Eubacterium sp. TaxID=165185 RepID=UPI0026727D06|nr:LCP family protein [uncultured Eubacterium sp.]
MSSKKIKTPEKQLKTIKIWKRIITTIEVIFGVLLIAMAIILFVPNVKAELIKGMASTPIGQKIISWFGSEAYAQSVFDSNFDMSKLIKNELKYNYSEEYTTFVLFGVDSREGEVEASNSDSILIVNIHNTTGEVKMASVYRDTMLGIYDKEGNLNKYFKINSAYAGGGPEAAINTLNKNLDLDIQDYVTVNFSGVAEIINQLGGITVNLTDDELSQLNRHLKSTLSSTGQYTPQVKKSGKNIKLNGLQATTYCRIRKATFYDPDTGDAISDDFGRAARQRLVMMKLVEKAKKAGLSELQGMVQAVMNDNSDGNRIISTSFTFDEIINLIPVIFDFELSGSQGFPSELTTGTYDTVSFVVARGLSHNVSELHKFFYGEENYQPTDNVLSVENYVAGYTGITADSNGFNPTQAGQNTTEPDTTTKADDTNYDYDDKGKSDFY